MSLQCRSAHSSCSFQFAAYDAIGYDFALTYGQETGVRTGYDTIVSRFQLPMFLRGVDEIRPEGVRVAEDGSLIQLPLGSKDIQIGSLQ